MYISFHSSVATAVLLTPLPLSVKVPLAILSHIPADTLGEAYLGEDWVGKETILNGILLLVGFLLGQLPLVLLGILSGNLIDLFDKVVSAKLFKREIIHEAKWYPPVLKNLTLGQTEVFNIGSVIIACGLLFL